MKRILFSSVAAVGLLGSGTATFAQDQTEQEEKSCAVVYQGETSRLQFCDDNSIDWTMPRDALRIDKPLEPGPNALPNEVKEKVIDKPAKWAAKTFGW
ncbi:hypothetical protein [Shimia sp. MMG029]|uniref:hypothetical protein n=1 Tax=Shimia sp. MMG029 TaxID=3021978 RepID=UPI0022FE0C29|nr:hypothetical protein [Shimia sp. MMG029]MDA5558689.1 hypothetical protein [Shimia sp. MMG029]